MRTHFTINQTNTPPNKISILSVSLPIQTNVKLYLRHTSPNFLLFLLKMFFIHSSGIRKTYWYRIYILVLAESMALKPCIRMRTTNTSGVGQNKREMYFFWLSYRYINLFSDNQNFSLEYPNKCWSYQNINWRSFSKYSLHDNTYFKKHDILIYIFTIILLI